MALKLIISREPNGQEIFYDFPASSLSEVYTSENSVVLFFSSQTITGNGDVNPDKFYYGTRITLGADGRGASLGLSIGRILAAALNSPDVESRINLFELADSVSVEDIIGSAPTGGGGTGGSNETLNTVTTRGATTGNAIDVGGIKTDYVQLDITATPTAQQGMFSWNADRSTANLQLDTDVAAKIGQDNYWYVKNQTGSTIPIRTAVMASGTLGASGRILVSPMIANGSVDAKFLLGITAEEILDGDDGFVMNIGKIRQVNTSLFPAGTVLYCDPTVPGGLTGSEPQAPNLKIAIAFSIFQDNSNGTIAVRANAGSDLYSDHRVQVDQAGLTGGQLLRYNNTLSRWENWTPNYLTTTPTLAQVTTAGNTTTNAITVGGLLVQSSTGGSSPWFTPTATLQGTNPGFYMQNTGTGGGFGSVTVGNTTGNLFFSFSSTKDFAIQSTDGSSFNYRFTIKPTGNVLIGTTTDAGYRLDVNGSTRVQGELTVNVPSGGNLIRESLVKMSVADAPNDAFFIGNGTAYNNTFWPSFAGFGTSSQRAGLGFLGIVNETSDAVGDGATSVLQFEAQKISGTSDPLNAPRSAVTTKSILTVLNYNAVYLRMFANGNLGINTTTDAGYKLDVNGTGRFKDQLRIERTSNSRGFIFSSVSDDTIQWNNGTLDIQFNSSSPVSIARISNGVGGVSYLTTKLNINAPNVISNLGYSLGVYGNLRTNGSVTASSTIARGVLFDNTLVAAANNDVLVGLDINPTFTNGAYSFVDNIDLRLNSTGKIVIGSNSTFGSTITSTGAAFNGGNSTVSSTGNFLRLWANKNSNNSLLWLGAGRAGYTGEYIRIDTSEQERVRITSPGNVLINTTTDSGYKLDVNGTTRLNGLTSINSTSVANTALTIGANGTGAGNYIVQGYDISSNQRFYLTASGNFRINGAADNGASGSDEKFRLDQTFNPTSGTRIHFGMWLRQTINQTGGANGITRGLYVNPTLTAAADFRAIETTAGKIIHQGLTNATQTNQVYYNTTTGELTYGALPVVATPTLEQVTTAGNTTTNAVTVDKLTVSTGTSKGIEFGGTKVVEAANLSSYTQLLTQPISGNKTAVLMVAPSGTEATSVLELYHSSSLSSNQRVAFKNVNGLLQLGGDVASFPIEFIGSNNAWMKIFASGNVAINSTTDAGYKLDVNGTARVLGTTVSNLLVESTTDGANSTSTIGTKVGTVGAFFRSYGSSFSVASLAGTAGFGPNGASGLVIFTNAGSPINGSGYLSIRGGGYDSGAEMVYVDKNGTALKGNITAVSNIARGVNVTPVLTASANSDVLVGLDISTTFTNGAFTGVANYGLRIGGSTGLIYDQTNNRLSTGGLPTNPISINTSTANPNGTIALFKTSLDDYTAFQVQNSIAAWQFSVRPTADISNPGGFNFYYSGNNGASWNNIMTLRTNGNVGIGTTTDAGYKLDVNGTIRSKFTTGYNNTTTDGSIVLTSSNDGNVALGVTTDLALRIKLNTIGMVFTSTSGQLWVSGTRIYAFNNTGVLINSDITNTTSTNDGSLIVNNNVNYVSASHIYTAQRINPTITGVTGCIARGLFISPTLTSVSDFRAIETSAGKVIHQGLTNASQANLIYYNSSTGELTYAAPQQTTAQTVADASKITASAATGSTQVASISASSYRSARFEYTITDSTNSRTGTVSAVWLGSSVQFSETTTQDIGDTSSLTFGVSVTGGTAGLVANATTGGWTVYVVGYGI